MSKFFLYVKDLLFTKLKGISRKDYILIKVRNVVAAKRWKGLLKLLGKQKHIEFEISHELGKFWVTTKNDTLMHSSIYEELGVRDWIKFSKKRNIFIDVGANVGFYTILAHRSKYKKIYSFEPNPLIYDVLEKNVKLNKLEPVVKLNKVGLGSKNESTTFHYSKTRTGRGSFKLEAGGKERTTLKVKKFDTYVKANKLLVKDISFIKIDVEGFELDVLKGMKQTLKSAALGTCVFVEMTKENKKEGISLLRDLGFAVKKVKDINYLFVKRATS